MMKILVTNDDGINAPSLWALAGELQKVGQVYVVAPDRERIALCTAVSLFKPLHVQEFAPPVKGVIAYAADGTPGDCVILGHGKLVKGLDIVVSGVNPGPNIGEDVYISGTVGAAMQGYSRGLPALAVSASFPNKSTPKPGVILPVNKFAIEAGARLAAFLVKRMAAEGFAKLFLNLNVPDLPLAEIQSLKLTRLARSSHINTVTEDTQGEVKHYRLVRSRIDESGRPGTDIHAIMEGSASLTPIYMSLRDKPPPGILKKLTAGLLNEAKKV
jgi:5'-nucleotidase